MKKLGSEFIRPTAGLWNLAGQTPAAATSVATVTSAFGWL
jgi:hypothetical protein